jgi:hypothetical protein
MRYIILVVSNREMKGRHRPPEYPHHMWEYSEGILSIFFTGGSYRGVKRSVESKVPLKSIRKDVRTPEKPVKCRVPNSLFYCVTFGGSKPSHGFFIGAEVGVALNPYTKHMYELCKVNEVKLFLYRNLYF